MSKTVLYMITWCQINILALWDLKTREVIKIISWHKDKYLFIFLTFYDCEFMILLKNISTFFLQKKKQKSIIRTIEISKYFKG